MSATLLQDGTRSDIARSARPYLVTSKGTGFIPLMASFQTFGRGTNHQLWHRAHIPYVLQITHCIHNDMKPVTQTKSMLCLVTFP